ncbi:MAG TPA: MFS transporter [Acidobacteriota bacterium]|nr:MFS transporter [Acidobacteriota bacterium]
MFSLLTQRNYGLFWFGDLISGIGDWVRIAALPFFIYEITGSALATGSMFVAQALPTLLFGSLAGVFVDRWDRKRTMIISAIARALILLPLLLVTSAEYVWIIYAVAFAGAIVSLFASPAYSAIIPALVKEDDLIGANSLGHLNDNFARLIGPSLGGALLAMTGLVGVVLIDAFSFLLSAALIGLIRLDTKSKRQEAEEETAAEPAQAVAKSRSAAWVKVWRDWVEGLKMVARRGPLASVFLVQTIALLGDNILTVLFVVFISDTLKAGSLEFGWALTARGLGGLIGGLVVGQFGKKLKASRVFSLGLTGSGLFFLAVVNSRSLWLVLVLVTLAGITAVAWLSGGYTQLQRSTPDAYRGRIFGTFGTTASLMTLTGMAAGGFLADLIGHLTMLNVAAALYLVAGLLAFALFRGSAGGEVKYEAPSEEEALQPEGDKESTSKLEKAL